MKVILSSAYFAPVEYYTFLSNAENILIEKHENYIKQTYRNRCTILSSNGPMALSIPVESNNGRKCLIRDIRIAEHGNWQHLHWNAIVSAYNSTPFFEYYQDNFYPFYSNKFTYLFDFNEQIREITCLLLDIPLSKIKYTEDYQTNLLDKKDFREYISPKKDWNIFNSYFISHPYYQVFEKKYGFTGNLSIMDLLFNMGPESQIILQKGFLSSDKD